MVNELVTIKDSKRAVHLVSEHIRGSRIRFDDLLAKQNLVITPDPHFRTLKVIKPLLEPDCCTCLYESGYYPNNAPAYMNWEKGAALVAPKRLQECKKALAGIVPTIDMETDDGIKFSFALSQGCRAGWGSIEEKRIEEKRIEKKRPRYYFDSFTANSYFIVNPSSKDANDSHPVVFPDPRMIPVVMVGKFTSTFGASGGKSSDGFWKAAKIEPLPVRGVTLTNRKESDGETTRSANLLEFTFKATQEPALGMIDMRFFSLSLDLGNYAEGVEPFFWIDMIAKDGFTTRFLIDNGFPGLLFPDHFKTPF